MEAFYKSYILLSQDTSTAIGRARARARAEDGLSSHGRFAAAMPDLGISTSPFANVGLREFVLTQGYSTDSREHIGAGVPEDAASPNRRTSSESSLSLSSPSPSTSNWPPNSFVFVPAVCFSGLTRDEHKTVAISTGAMRALKLGVGQEVLIKADDEQQTCAVLRNHNCELGDNEITMSDLTSRSLNVRDGSR